MLIYNKHGHSFKMNEVSVCVRNPHENKAQASDCCKYSDSNSLFRHLVCDEFTNTNIISNVVMSGTQCKA